MAQRGRIGKNKPVITEENHNLAEHWMKTISKYYDEYNNQFKKYKYPEDLINTTVVYCYECIERNGLSDTSDQGCKNYFYRAYNSNLAHLKDPYNQRKDENIQVPEAPEAMTAEEKWNKQLYKDYSVLYLLKAAEQQFDHITFWCFRIKHLVPKTSYERLRQITGLKDCKKRVVTVNRWLKANITKDEIMKSFQMDFPDFQN